jgi:PadR family transcriptional regulator, regulatory protein PadR
LARSAAFDSVNEPCNYPSFVLHLGLLKERSVKLDIPQGTLDLMILTILVREPLHGYGISQRIAVLSHDQFHVNPGSLFPSLYRLEQDGKLKAEWRPTENNRRAKYYRLTASGRRQLEQHRERWDRVSFAVASVLEGA